MEDRVERAGLRVSSVLAAFIEDAALPGTGLAADAFWSGFSALLHDLAPRNRALLARREQLQGRIDDWHIAHAGQPHDADDYRAFLTEIGYLLPEGPAFTIDPGPTDPEIATIAGPQLVVPITNARFALNAANARWGSLYDALYGTDALGDAPAPGPFDPARGARVTAAARAHLDAAVPLAGAAWADVVHLGVTGGTLAIRTSAGPVALADSAQFAAWLDAGPASQRILLRANGLLIEIVIDPSHATGRADPAGIADIRLESAVSAIMDCEDSVACVDAADKVTAYANWLGLMQGTLTETFDRNGRTITRSLNPATTVWNAAGGGTRAVRGRALMLVRNVGLLMTTPAILDRDGAETPEGLMDAMLTVLCALHDLRRPGGPVNSPAGRIYVVKPKLHGPEEAAFAALTFDRVEAVLGLPANTVRVGLMDEERRTSANLTECIRALRHRLCFINTGFLDRTGDEIHTSMEAGPMLPKGEMKATPWLAAYEDRNVDAGLACGLVGHAQIGKGMWAAPDRMADMLAQKIAHPMAGASCAWVPSPTAATLHATHYHRVDVAARQAVIAAGGTRAGLDALLTIPVAAGRNFDPARIAAEIENNAQGILGYVVRWIGQGIGCSKVPDIHDVALMEDRATCRISAQALANWLHHGVVTEAQVMAALRRMAAVVDRQNAADPSYVPMAPEFDGIAFQAACDLVFKGRIQPSGYTEPVLHRRRLERKAARPDIRA
jgi:malate synthase